MGPADDASPLDAFRASFRDDIAADAVRPLGDYLVRFPGDEVEIAAAYRAAMERAAGAPEPVAEDSGDRIAHYRIIRQIGRGGQATVYLAEDTRLHRQVALKVLDPGHGVDPMRLARFRREAEITSKLDNSGICAVYDSGEHQGVLWIAMRYVEGESLADKISTAKEHARSDTTSFVEIPLAVTRDEPAASDQTTTEPPSGPKTWTEIMSVVALFEKVARTLHVAHEAGVIHRDIKPGNVIVTRDGEPVILDFGIAQEVEGNQPTLTLTGDLMGTPAYMSPEQIAAHRIRLDRRTDVYSLGVALFECLALRRPFEAPTRDALYQAIMTQEAPDLRRLNPAIPSDLRVVVATALEKDRNRRYQTAFDLAEELRRVRMREPIVAKPVGPIVRVQRWARREPALAASLVGAFLALAIGLVVALLLLGAVDRALGDTKKALDEKQSALAASQALLAEAARSDIAISRALVRNGRHSDALAYLARACQHASESLFAAEQAVLIAVGHPSPFAILEGHTNVVSSAEFSPDGGRIVTASHDKTARVWDSRTGKTLATLEGHTDGVFSAEFSPDGGRIVTASHDKTARVWDSTTGKTLATLEGHTDPVFSAEFSPDGGRIVTASHDVTARVWDSTTGKTLATLEGHTASVWSAEFSPDGGRIVTASSDNTARVWDCTTGKILATLEGHTGPVYSAEFSPDGGRIVTASFDKTARVSDSTTGKTLATLEGHTAWVSSAQFSPDGARIVTASFDKTARVSDSTTGKTLATLEGHTAPVWSVEFSPDGGRIVTASHDKTARVWDSTTGKTLATLEGHTDQVLRAKFSPDGGRIVTASSDKTARVWDSTIGKTLATLEGHTDGVQSAEFSPDGGRIVTASSDKTARVWDSTTGKTLATLEGHTDRVCSAKFSPDGGRIVTASDDKTARVWDSTTGKTLATLEGHTDKVSSAEFSPDGGRIVTASHDVTARVWDSTTGKTLATLEGHTDGVQSAEFSPDGGRIVTASHDVTARVWDSTTGKTLATLEGHTGSVWSAEFSPDGGRIVTASSDNTARVWDCTTGKTLATLEGHTDGVESAEYSPDGGRIVTASSDKTARLWDSTTGKTLATLEGHTSGVFRAEYSPDGGRIVTASYDKTARVWDSTTGKTLVTLEGHDGGVSSAKFSPDGGRILTTSEDNTARVWETLGTTQSPPEWFAEFLRVLASRELDKESVLVDIPAQEWLIRRNRVLEASKADRSRYGEIARHCLASGPDGTVRPGATMTRREAADSLIDSDATKEDIERAYAWDPANPLVQIALARFETDSRRAAFLRGYGRDLIEAAPARARAALRARAEKLLQAARPDANDASRPTSR